MKQRIVILAIDDIARLFKDYVGLSGFPEDAQCDTLLFNNALQKMCLRISSASFPSPQPSEAINFELKRTFLAS